MGIGFKSVFGRFREVRVSGWGWTFRYEISQYVGKEYGDVQTDLLGAVIPIWDNEIEIPEIGFTTRFEMSLGVGEKVNLQNDLTHLVPENDRTLLAILADSGLKNLKLDDREWKLNVLEKSDGGLQATAFSKNENLRWQIFPVQFEPSSKAIAHFLKHRGIRPSLQEREQVYAEAAKPRRVLGILPLGNHNIPATPNRGKVYATLPTEVTIPFGIHIHADWLLDISRSGFREIEDNAWQRGIVDKIADILTIFLVWVGRTFSDAAAIGQAFKVLALPSRERDTFEALFAKDEWLSRLRTQLEDAAVLPVWSADALAFKKPGDVIVPPKPLATAFSESPALRPSILLKGPVLRRTLLGSNAFSLLHQAGLFAEMAPEQLERTWQDGLEHWWENIPDEQKVRRDLLFRIWAAVAELASQDVWRDVNLPCIRTSTEQWLPVCKAMFCQESFPVKDNPGGDQTLQFIQPFIPYKILLPSPWVNALEKGTGYLSSAWAWIQGHAQRVTLKEIFSDAINDLMKSSNPDWSVLVSLGHWAKNGNRSDLLTCILVDSENGPKGVPAKDALLADPYVEHGQDRRLLFPATPAIAAAYLEQDISGASPHEWRTFLEKAGPEKAGPLGALKVFPVKCHASRWDRKQVAKFLGLALHEEEGSNSNGYSLLDFKIAPDLPGPEAPEELRRALATWLYDSFRVLRDKGRRKAQWSYRGQHYKVGKQPSLWVRRLSEIAWVPCNDGALRCPEDVLPRDDPAREDAPVAKLSPEMVSVLEEEGVQFGEAIPAATSFRRLLKFGSQLDAKALAQLLCECREQIATDEDRYHFEKAVQELKVPLNDNTRIPCARIVQRAGGRLRGTLGGWIVPLDDIDESLRMELQHPDFPYQFPDATTGSQALAYLREVWACAKLSPEGLATKVRDVLPAAYAYCLEDRVNSSSLSESWDVALPEAAVFAERNWIVLAETNNIYFDDIENRRFLPSNMQLQTVTSGHLGNSQSDQSRTVEALGLRRLSSDIKMKWRGEDKKLRIKSDWISRFNYIFEILQQVRGSDIGEADSKGMIPQLIHVCELVLNVSFGADFNERIPVHARLYNDVLTVAGYPVQFSADAAKELLSHFSFGQRADLAADLTGMLGAIDSPSDFSLAADKFRRAFAPDFQLPPESQNGVDDDEVPDSGYEQGKLPDAAETPLVEQKQTSMGESAPQASRSDVAEDEPDMQAVPSQGMSEEADTIMNNESIPGGSYTRDRALAEQNIYAKRLKNLLKGEITPIDNRDTNNVTKKIKNSDPSLGDEKYRQVAEQYEKEFGREPILGDPHQSGWDIRSVDPKTGDVRFIEVKGKGRPWTNDEVVELSRPQIKKAFEVSVEQADESWYLYVVEKIDQDRYRVLPIENPVRVAANWILSGESWRMVAKEPRVL